MTLMLLKLLKPAETSSTDKYFISNNAIEMVTDNVEKTENESEGVLKNVHKGCKISAQVQH